MIRTVSWKGFRGFGDGFGCAGQVRRFSGEILAIGESVSGTLEMVHEWAGVPWWMMIPATTFALRGVWTMPLAIFQRRRIRKQVDLRSIVSATNPVTKYNLAKKVEVARKKADNSLSTVGDVEDASPETLAAMQSPIRNMKYEQIVLLAAKETRKRQKELFQRHRVQVWKNFVLPACQIPLWVGMSWTMRTLSGWNSWDSTADKPLDPTLYTEGLFWFGDLTSSDPLHVFPVVLGLLSLCNIEWTFKTLELLKLTLRKLMRLSLVDSLGNVSRMSIVFMMAVAFKAPVALVLYWVSLQVFSLVQNILLDIFLPVSYTPNKRIDYKKADPNTHPKPVINKSFSL